MPANARHVADCPPLPRGTLLSKRSPCPPCTHPLLGAAAAPPHPTPCPQKIQRRPSEISVVSVMPCVRKQGEADRMMFHTPDGSARCARCARCGAARLGLRPCLAGAGAGQLSRVAALSPISPLVPGRLTPGTRPHPPPPTPPSPPTPHCPLCSEVDHVITTRELAKMCQDQGIDFANLPGGWAPPPPRRPRVGPALQQAQSMRLTPLPARWHWISRRSARA